MGADLEAGARRDRRAAAMRSIARHCCKARRAARGVAGVVSRLSGRPNRIMAPSPRKLVMIAPCATTSAIDQGMEILQQRQPCVEAERFAQRGEAGQIDEDDRGIVMHRLQQELRISGQPFAQRRRLELLQQIAPHRVVVRLPPVQPELDRSEQDRRRRGGGNRQGRAEPDAARKRRIIDDRPDREHGGDRARARACCAAMPAEPPATASAAPPRARQSHASNGRAGFRHRPSTAPVAAAISSTTRQHRIERRGKHVAAAGNGRADHDDAVLEDAAATSPFNSAAALMVGPCLAAAVK